MTHKEMSEIFAVMLLAYPNAEVFKGGIAKLGPTINLWVTCLPEIDFWTGQQAVVSWYASVNSRRLSQNSRKKPKRCRPK